MENTTPHEYTDLAAVYLRQLIHTQYRLIIKPLLQAGILQSTNYYRPGYHNHEEEYIKGQCLSYRINPDLLDDEVIKIHYKGEKQRQKCRDQVTMSSKQIMRQIRIPDMNSRELITFVKASLTDDRIRNMIKVNSPDGSICEITDETIYLKSVGSEELEMMNEKCRPQAGKYVKVADLQLRTKCLIKDGKQYHIEHLDTYIKRKRRHLTQAYCDQLLRIKHRNIYADRNETNLRLDSNLTNLKSEFMSLLTIDGQRLSQVDLKNSQFRFFVYLLEQCERDIRFGKEPIEENFGKFYSASDRKIGIRKEGKRIEGKPVTLLLLKMSEIATRKQGLMVSFSKDYLLFKELVKTGQLYEHVRELIWKDTGRNISRKEAKKIMFTIAFSSYRYEPAEKQVIKRHFPSIVGIIDGYKKLQVEKLESCKLLSDQEARDRGNASFAILLQQVESLIFIDEILSKCHRKGIKALSKHDSIVCRQSDKHKVTKIVCKVLNSLFGRYTYAMDIDGELFDLKPKRKSRIAKVATTLFSHLIDRANPANAPPTSVASGEYRVASVDVKSTECRVASIQEPAYSRTSTLLAGEKIRSERVRRLRDRIMGR